VYLGRAGAGRPLKVGRSIALGSAELLAVKEFDIAFNVRFKILIFLG